MDWMFVVRLEVELLQSTRDFQCLRDWATGFRKRGMTCNDICCRGCWLEFLRWGFK